jgi:hypothetical protein
MAVLEKAASRRGGSRSVKVLPGERNRRPRPRSIFGSSPRSRWSVRSCSRFCSASVLLASGAALVFAKRVRLEQRDGTLVPEGDRVPSRSSAHCLDDATSTTEPPTSGY